LRDRIRALNEIVQDGEYEPSSSDPDPTSSEVELSSPTLNRGRARFQQQLGPILPTRRRLSPLQASPRAPLQAPLPAPPRAPPQDPPQVDKLLQINIHHHHSPALATILTTTIDAHYSQWPA
ncbi:hypothetical protein A4X13_0g9334, partial [Tilletia indica]